MTAPVRIPADVDVEDRVLGPLTARQLAILGTTGLALYLAWTATRSVLPLAVFLPFAVAVAGGMALLVLGQQDGLSLDRLLLAAVRQRLQPRHRVASLEEIQPVPSWVSAHTATADSTEPGEVSPGLRLPAEEVTETGVVDLGQDGLAVVAVCSTVNFALRTAEEQDALVAGFARYLHSLTAPVQLLVRTERLDLSQQIAELDDQAATLPHPALQAAAREHADYLADLASHADLLCRQVLLVLREPRHVTTPEGLGSPLAGLGRLRSRQRAHDSGEQSAAERRAAEARLVRRLAEASELLASAGIVVTALDARQATAVLTSACNPDTLVPPSTDLATADEVITAPPVGHPDAASTFDDEPGWS